MSSRNGKIVTVVAVVIAFALLGWSIRSNIGQSTAVAAANDHPFVNAKTGKAFNYKMTLDTHFPVKCPDTGENEGYPAELCYWTKEGTAKSDPTSVLLNAYRGQSGATFCPDCGRLVVVHNPAPGPGVSPPPTQKEMTAP